MPPAILFYDVVLFVHVAAIIVAFGVTFAYPLIGMSVRASRPEAVADFHRAQELVGKRLIAPFGGIAFLAGIYLAADRDLFDRVWVTVPMLILIVLLVSGGAFFGPTEKRLAELAARDVSRAAPGSQTTFSDEYEALNSRLKVVGTIMPLLVLVAVFMMVVKPGGY
jgi:hypothetical protein